MNLTDFSSWQKGSFFSGSNIANFSYNPYYSQVAVYTLEVKTAWFLLFSSTEALSSSSSSATNCGNISVACVWHDYDYNILSMANELRKRSELLAKKNENMPMIVALSSIFTGCLYPSLPPTTSFSTPHRLSVYCFAAREASSWDVIKQLFPLCCSASWSQLQREGGGELGQLAW